MLLSSNETDTSKKSNLASLSTVPSPHAPIGIETSKKTTPLSGVFQASLSDQVGSVSHKAHPSYLHNQTITTFDDGND